MQIASSGESRHVGVGQPVTSTGHEDAAETRATLIRAQRLWGFVKRVTAEEFRWQESHYDRDSRLGRELLFLIANNEWVRATSEIVDIVRSDAADTTIKIDIDLDQLTHEAFRRRFGRFWLPILVLSPQASASKQQASKKLHAGKKPLESQRPEPDPFTTVTDARGNLLAMLPSADVRHRISAAMAEIIVNMAVARWTGRDDQRPTATRDQRLLLSASIYRLLRSGVAGSSSPSAAVEPDLGREVGSQLSRLDNAKEELFKLFSRYIGLSPHQRHITDQADTGNNIGVDGLIPAQRSRPEWESDHSTLELTRRAVMVMEAFAESVVVVVPLDRKFTPTVLTVRLPAREIDSPRTWELLNPFTWALRPLGHLQIDVLLPSADADRQVQVNLPDGMVFMENGARSSLEIQVEPPQPLKHLTVLMDQILHPCKRERDVSLRQCLADLASAKIVGVRETLRHYDVDADAGQKSNSGKDRRTATNGARAKLTQLKAELDDLSTGRFVDATAIAGMQTTWGAFCVLTQWLFRRTSADRSSPRTVVARTDMIEDISQRASLTTAKVDIYVEVADAAYFSIARFSGWLSVLLMAVVLAAFPLAHRLGYTSEPSAEVFAIVLTFFSAIQAGRIERPDRSTLHGLLSTVGNWLIVASILPTVMLAVVLAFHPSHAVYWAVGGIALQLILQLAMWRGPLAAGRSLGHARPREFRTRPPDYRHSDVLRTNWWRSTTADALLIGRRAYAYVVWQEGESATLTDLLSDARLARPPSIRDAGTAAPKRPSVPRFWAKTCGTVAGRYLSPGNLRPDSASSVAKGHPANVLALLRAGSADQNVTFVVFREKPAEGWAGRAHVRALDLDPDRLAPLEHVVSIVDVFIGVPRQRGLLSLTSHPLKPILEAADRHHLIILEIQLPIPPSFAVRADCYWARVRVGLRDADVGQLSPFLADVHEVTAIGGTGGGQSSVIGVRTVPSLKPRIIAGSAVEDAGSRLILASDMDMISLATNKADSTGAHWRVLAICADARSGIEYDIMQRLGEVRPRLHLAGLTYGLLHGTAVVLLLGHEPDGHTAPDADLRLDLRGNNRALAKIEVLINGWRTQTQLGHVEPQPLLRVYFRAQDRPGALHDVLESLGTALQDNLPSLKKAKWRVWHARTRLTGHAAETRLTVRLDTDALNLGEWGPSIFDNIARKVRALAARDAAAAQITAGSFIYESDAPEDPVITVTLIKAPTPSRDEG